MEIKKVLMFIMCILGTITITYGIGTAIITGYEYEAEKILDNDSKVLNSVKGVKDEFITEKIEPTTDKVLKGYFKFVSGD